MRAVAITLVAIGGAVGLWAICSQLPTDAISMGVGLIFGVLASVPTALLMLYAGGNIHQGRDYQAGYDAGRHEAHREMLIVDAHRQLMQAQYTQARPFYLVDGEVKP